MNETEYQEALTRSNELDNDSPELVPLLAAILAYERIYEPDYVEA